ncbi:MAG: prepilin peptidase [Candidatus Margulisbacteria bacterium]|nr:prepilin peptidase [Candidatus Margulisiibacteriota bacterium]
MLAIKSMLAAYAVMVGAYLLNVLITELPLDDRYQKLKVHFTFRRFFSLSYYPFIYWFLSGFKHSKISIKVRHVVVLVFSFGLFFTHVFGYTMLNPAVHYIVFSMLTICLFTDIEHQIIPNEISFGLIVVGIATSIFNQTIGNGLKGIGLAIVVFLIFSIIMMLFGQQHAFGAGDIKLCLGIGAVWGWQVTAIALYFTFLIGGVVGFYFLVIKKKSRESYYAFAPVIILGLIVALLYTDSIFDYYYPWVNNSFQIQRAPITP